MDRQRYRRGPFGREPEIRLPAVGVLGPRFGEQPAVGAAEEVACDGGVALLVGVEKVAPGCRREPGRYAGRPPRRGLARREASRTAFRAKTDWPAEHRRLRIRMNSTKSRSSVWLTDSASAGGCTQVAGTGSPRTFPKKSGTIPPGKAVCS